MNEAAVPSAEPELSSGWKNVFRVEIAVCALSVIYWLGDPGGYLRDAYELVHIDNGHLGVLWQLAGLVFAIFVVFYSRILFASRTLLRPFAQLQEALVVGDVLSALASAVTAPSFASRNLWIALVMATLWGSLRVWFLVDTRRERRTGPSPAQSPRTAHAAGEPYPPAE